MKLILRSMVLFVVVLLAFEAFSHPGQFASDTDDGSVIKWSPRQDSNPAVADLPLDLSLKSRNQPVSVNASVTHKQVLQDLHKFLVGRPRTEKPVDSLHKSRSQTRNPYLKRAVSPYDLGRRHAKFLVSLQKQGKPVGPFQKRIQEFYQFNLAH